MSAFPTCYLGYESDVSRPYSCNILREEPTEDNYMWLVQPVVHYNISLNHLYIMNKLYDVLSTTNSNGEILANPSCLSQSRLRLLKDEKATVENTLNSVQEYNHELYEAITNATKIINTDENHITITVQKERNNIMPYALV